MKRLNVKQSGYSADVRILRYKTAFIIGIMLVLSLKCIGAEAAWTSKTLDSNRVGANNSLAVDDAGYVHISYRDSENDIIKYITNESGSWQDPVTIDFCGDLGDKNSIAVDSRGSVHILYEMYDKSCQIKYASNGTGTWVIETLGVGTYPAINIDKSDNIHVCYEMGCYDTGKLIYATKISGTWKTEEITMSNDFDKCSIASDLSGHIHISCTGSYYTDAPLQYVTNKSGTWQTELLDFPGTLTNKDNDIAVDSSGYVHISYYISSNHDLKYATDKSGSWKYEVVDNTADDVGFKNSIAVDSSDNVHIVYVSETTSYYDYDIKYAANISGAWTKEVIAGEFVYGAYIRW